MHKHSLAHKHRQQFERGDTARTNLAATLSANTIVAFRTIPDDSKALTSLFFGIDRNRRPTNFYLYPTEKLYQHPNPTIKQFTREIVDKLDSASRQKLETQRGWYKDSMNPTFPGRIKHIPERSYTYKVNPQFDFGAGAVEANPDTAAKAATLLDQLIYDSEVQGQIGKEQRSAFLQSVAKFWKFENYLKGAYDNREERERYRRFVSQLDTA